MRNIKSYIIGLTMILSACTTLQVEPNRQVKTQFDFYCKSKACDAARDVLVDRKLVENEKKDLKEYKWTYTGEEIIKNLNATYKKANLNADCMKTAQKLIDDRYKGCIANINQPEAGHEEIEGGIGDDNYCDFEMRGIEGKSYCSFRALSERQCAIEMFNQVRQFVQICESTFWNEHKNTAMFMKEMADDGILETGLIRASHSFNSRKPEHGGTDETKEYIREPEIRLMANHVFFHSAIENEYDGNQYFNLDEVSEEDVANAKRKNAELALGIARLIRIGLTAKHGF